MLKPTVTQQQVHPILYEAKLRNVPRRIQFMGTTATDILQKMAVLYAVAARRKHESAVATRSSESIS